jgi:MFS family permease
VRGRLGAAAGAFVSNARNADLRRAQLSFGAAWICEWAFTVALGVYAFRQGGAAAVGLVLFLRMAPAAVMAPVVGPLADRWRRERVLFWVSAIRGAATAVAALLVAAGSPSFSVYVLAVLSTVAGTLYRPVHSAVLPSLCQTPYELTSANVVRGMVDSLAAVLGPLLAAVLLAGSGVTAVFAAAAGASWWSAGLILRVRREPSARPGTRVHAGVRAQLAGGVRAVAASGDLAVLLCLAAVQTFTRGALMVFSVIVAIDLLRIGGPGAGYLTAAVGAGAVLGSLAGAALVGTRRLAGWFGTGIALWGLPIALIGVFPSEAAALALLAVVGVGNAMVDFAQFTLMGRLAADEVMARVFILDESFTTLALAAGAIVTPLVIAAVGLRPALILLGMLCPLAVLAARWRLRRLDASMVIRDREVHLLRAVDMLRPLALPALEQLARGLDPAEIAAGAVVFNQGDVGDRFYVVEDGVAEVIGDGAIIATLGPGDAFGEIALLHRVPRTATIRARTPLRLKTLTAARFLTVVTGSPASVQHAAAGADAKLRRFSPAPRPGPGRPGRNVPPGA